MLGGEAGKALTTIERLEELESAAHPALALLKDPTLLNFLDGRTSELRAGMSYTQTSVLETAASIGRVLLDYINPSLTDAPSWVADGSLTCSPDETLTLKGSLETTLGPSTTVAGDSERLAIDVAGSIRFGRVNFDRAPAFDTSGASRAK